MPSDSEIVQSISLHDAYIALAVVSVLFNIFFVYRWYCKRRSVKITTDSIGATFMLHDVTNLLEADSLVAQGFQCSFTTNSLYDFEKKEYFLYINDRYRKRMYAFDIKKKILSHIDLDAKKFRAKHDITIYDKVTRIQLEKLSEKVTEALSSVQSQKAVADIHKQTAIETEKELGKPADAVVLNESNASGEEKV